MRSNGGCKPAVRTKAGSRIFARRGRKEFSLGKETESLIALAGGECWAS